MKLFLFILFNIFTTYNIYAYLCSGIINKRTFNHITFTFSKTEKKIVDDWQTETRRTVELYELGDRSNFTLHNFNYKIDKCESDSYGSVIFYYQGNNILEINTKGEIVRVGGKLYS